jgi:hypothetical protein
MKIRTIAFSVLAAAVCAAQGVKPRPQATDYPVQTSQDGTAIGAALVPPAEVRSAFVTDLNRGYAVVEIALYPKGGRMVDVNTDDFLLRVVGTKETSRPVRPKAVAAVLQRTAPTERNIDLYPTVGIGYESGGYDPMTGRRGGGVVTSTGVGVGVGSTKPAATDQDRKTMETELTEKGLPEGKTARAVAGYLYFPMRAKKRAVAYEIEYQGGSGTAVLPLGEAASRTR